MTTAVSAASRQQRRLSARAEALLAALLVLLLGLFIWQHAATWYETQLLTEQRAELIEALSIRSNALSSAMNRRLARLQGLHAFVQTEANSPDFDAKFTTFAAGIYTGSRGVRNLAVAPDGIVQYVYPLEGNESVVGYAPARDTRPEVQAGVAQAMASQQMVLTGPVELVQGGLGLIARQSVYQGTRWWGLVNVVLELDPLLQEAGLDEGTDDLTFTLRDENGRVFWGPESIFDESPLVASVMLPEGKWELAGVPTGGWHSSVQTQQLFFQGAGLVIVLLLASVTYLTVNRQAQLATAVRQRTQELEEASHLLEQRVEDRTRELSTLLQISQDVASTLELAPLLGVILDDLKKAVDYKAASVLQLTKGMLMQLEYRGPSRRKDAVGLRFPTNQMGLIWNEMQRGRPVIVDDVLAETAVARAYHDAIGDELFWQNVEMRAWLGVPLRLKERTIGMLALQHTRPGFFTPEIANLLMTIGNQAAVAIENANLYAQAQSLAAMEERQKLARELHDSVSQALYGIALGARTAHTLLQRGGDAQAQEPLEYVLSLAEAGLAEMRALIFELRPESLQQEGLVVALTKQAAALQARHHVEVTSVFCEEPAVSMSIKEALYRVAQEALHNVVKHAEATAVSLSLQQKEGRLVLTIEDNGRGFDKNGRFPGHLGLQSMQERVVRVAGHIDIESTPGAGTCIYVSIPITPPTGTFQRPGPADA